MFSKKEFGIVSNLNPLHRAFIMSISWNGGNHIDGTLKHRFRATQFCISLCAIIHGATIRETMVDMFGSVTLVQLALQWMPSPHFEPKQDFKPVSIELREKPFDFYGVGWG